MAVRRKEKPTNLVPYEQLTFEQRSAALKWLREVETPSYTAELDTLWSETVRDFTTTVPHITYSSEAKRTAADWGILVISDRVKKMTGARLQKMIRSEMIPCKTETEETFEKGHEAIWKTLVEFVSSPTRFEIPGRPLIDLQGLMDRTVQHVEEVWFRDKCQDWREELEKHLSRVYLYDPKTGKAHLKTRTP
jgi:hypothetical protein